MTLQPFVSIKNYASDGNLYIFTYITKNLPSLLLSYCYDCNKLLHIRFQRCLGNPFFFGLQYVRKGMLLCVNNKNEYINFCPILYGTKDLHS